MTHDPKLDDLALIEALKSAAFYVGALGSRLNTAKRKQRLAEFDLSQGELDRLHGPVGLRIGSKTPPEIAVSILAEMTAVRHGVDLGTVGTKESKEVVGAGRAGLRQRRARLTRFERPRWEPVGSHLLIDSGIETWQVH